MASKGSEESVFLYHEQCDCGSSDGRAVYSNNTKYCFVCKNWFGGEGEAPQAPPKGKRPAALIAGGEFRPLKARGISDETCKKFNYQVGLYKGESVHIANYYKKGSIVAQHLRFPDKDKGFPWLGDGKSVELFGQHLWRNTGGKRIVITEGEIDAMTVAQAFGLKWPVVAVAGADRAKKQILQELDFLNSFEEVVLAFDNDDPGRDAIQECAPLFSPNKVKIVQWPTGIKDANDLVRDGAGRIAEIPALIYEAKRYRPDGLVSIKDILEEVKKPVEWGLPWCFEELTKLTYGRRKGELYAFGAGTGVGKTDLLTQQIAHDVTILGKNVGLLFLEQKPVETAKRVAGKVVGKKFHVPDGGWTLEELEKAASALEGKITFYDNFGQTEWETVKAKIRYMVVAQGVELIYLDHLTALADTSDEKGSLEQIMKEMAGLANELGCIIHFVSHLTTPDGKPHEEGGRVTIRHFKGSRAIGFWSYFMFGLERNQQAEDEVERQATTFRILKDRYTGQSTGRTIPLKYDQEAGLLSVAEVNPMFGDETKKGESDF
ncbi:toprim domain-containing protein [Geobacter sp. SVR]|uniref:toprim domain-containing protein n=1 Tax=Geobacter sp. SVR TaxID=2495594 RepID=UPI00143EF861|nr:toprim domain-containing protein [Geobacter sp. SVR]BCS53323.1 hypothetical protein GSVR_16310 [Geobacter sp. SVR]GCF85551.1 hypothetical protein GSbR_21510 [Geobacter sp. SVR]